MKVPFIVFFLFLLFTIPVFASSDFLPPPEPEPEPEPVPEPEGDTEEMSEVEKQAREEIPNPCINIKEPKVPDEYLGDAGLNDPVFMETFREAQYQYNQQMQQCMNEYQMMIDQRVAELQCGDFEFGKYTPIEDYDLVYDLILRGLNKRSLATSEVLVQYKGNVLYENECQSFYKEWRQLEKETERWNESCPISSNPNGKKYSYMIDIFSVCRFATFVPVELSSQENEIVCGQGTVLKDGFCVPDRETMTTEMQQKSGGGCLIATATFGSELAPQVQQLREIRDNSLLQTESGRSFMKSFNQFYYSFSPTIADLERENPVFKEVVKLTITPLLSSLSLLNYVDMDSEVEVLGYGISLILLNVGMYFVLPAIVIHRVRKFV